MQGGMKSLLWAVACGLSRKRTACMNGSITDEATGSRALGSSEPGRWLWMGASQMSPQVGTLSRTEVAERMSWSYHWAQSERE